MLILPYVDFFTGANTSQERSHIVHFKCLRAHIHGVADMCLWSFVIKNTSVCVKFKFMQSNEVRTTFIFSFLFYQSLRILSISSWVCFLKLVTKEIIVRVCENVVCVKVILDAQPLLLDFLSKWGLLAPFLPRGVLKRGKG